MIVPVKPLHEGRYRGHFNLMLVWEINQSCIISSGMGSGSFVTLAESLGLLSHVLLPNVPSPCSIMSKTLFWFPFSSVLVFLVLNVTSVLVY